ncbi:MAG: hypothetical protein ACI8QZ_003549 [Chlamydiales bacterium]|jgi:hypothetical protein
MSGTASFDRSACQDTLDVTASIQPGGFTAPPRVAGTFATPTITIEFHALITLDSSHITGTYAVLVGDACTGDAGTFTASLQAPLQADPGDHFYTETVVTGADGQTRVIRTETEMAR